MGHGSYSLHDRSIRAQAMGYDFKPREEIFTQRRIHNEMDPNGVTLREARDSVDHPSSFPVILVLDETGSMGRIPHYLVQEGLPHMMQKIMDSGIADPQVLFMGVGDHYCDRAPLQVGQFESSDELLDKWLTDLYLEGHGGGNGGESYLLAWFFAGRYTETDSFEKRGRKGVLVTIGDEPVHDRLESNYQKDLMGPGEYSTLTAIDCLEKAREKYEVFHLHMLEGQNGKSVKVQSGWKELMQDNCILVKNKEQVADVIADVVAKVALSDRASKSEVPGTSPVKVVEEML